MGRAALRARLFFWRLEQTFQFPGVNRFEIVGRNPRRREMDVFSSPADESAWSIRAREKFSAEYSHEDASLLENELNRSG